MLNPTDAPNIILDLAGVSARPSRVLENRDYIESLPVDGIVMNVPASWQAMSPGRVVTGAELKRDLQPLAEFNAGFEANYLNVFTDRPGDLADDAAWAQVTENWRLIAREAKEAGFAGIIFDNEEYQGEWENFPEDYPAATMADLPLYQALAAWRGREIMEAINEEFPDAEVGVMHGPYRSVPRVDGAPEAISLQAGGSDLYEMAGPFFTGLLEGMGDGQTLIDMGELYALRSEAEFAQSQEYRLEVVNDLVAAEWDVDPQALARWDEIDFAHMVYTGDFPTGFTQDPASMRETMINALAHSENAVFLYADWQLVDLLDPTRDNNAEWIAALEEVRETRNAGAGAPGPQPLPSPQPEPTPPPQTGDAPMIVGDASDEVLRGDGRADEIYGNGGDDLIAPSAGVDFFGGGTGFDLVSYASSGTGVTVNLIDGTGWGGDAEGDTFVGMEGAIGSRSGDLLIGNWETVRLDGRGGADELYGNGGDDVLIGGGGADIVAGGEGRDTASFASSGAGVRVDLSRALASGGDAEGDTLISIENLVGSAFADALTGDDGANTLFGNSGDNVLTGGGGADVFVVAREGDTVVTDFEEAADSYAFEDGADAYANLRVERADAGGAIITWDGGSVLFEGRTVGGITGAGRDLGFGYGDLDPFG